MQWVGWPTGGTRRRSRVPGAAERADDLVFDGLDTVARVELNGVLVAETRNMHRSYRFDVGPLLQDGTNVLAVTFRSPVKAADRFSEELGRRPHVNHHPYNAIRKMACNFGWDWGPDAGRPRASGSRWRSSVVGRPARVRSARWPRSTAAPGRSSVHVDVERAPACRR